jgi:hypothetical protein
MDANSLNGSGVNPNPAGYWAEQPVLAEIVLNAPTNPAAPNRGRIPMPSQPSQQTAQGANLQGRVTQPNLQQPPHDAGQVLQWDFVEHQFSPQQKQIPTQHNFLHPQQNLQNQNQQFQRQQPAQLGPNQFHPQQNLMPQQPMQNQNQQFQRQQAAQLGPNQFHPQQNLMPQQLMQNQNQQFQQQQAAQLMPNQFLPQQNFIPQHSIQNQNQQFQQQQPAQLMSNQFLPQQNLMSQQPVWKQQLPFFDEQQQQRAHLQQQFQYLQQFSNGANVFQKEQLSAQDQVVLEQIKLEQKKLDVERQKLELKRLKLIKEQNSNTPTGGKRADPFGSSADNRNKRPRHNSGVNNSKIIHINLTSSSESEEESKPLLTIKREGTAAHINNHNVVSTNGLDVARGALPEIKREEIAVKEEMAEELIDMTRLAEKFKGIIAQFTADNAPIDDQQFFELEKISLALLANFNAEPTPELKSQLSLAFHILAKHCIGEEEEDAIKEALIDKAIHYYASAEKFASPENVEEILFEVSLFCRMENRYAQEIEQLKKLAQYKNGGRACNRIGCIYFEKHELFNDVYKKATKYLKLGSKKGDLTACYNLAQLYDIMSFKAADVESKIKYKGEAIAVYKKISEGPTSQFSGKAIFSKVFLSSIDRKGHFKNSQLERKRNALQNAKKEDKLDERIPLALALISAILHNKKPHAKRLESVKENLSKAAKLGSQIASKLQELKSNDELINALIAYIKKPYAIYNENRDLTKLSD